MKKSSKSIQSSNSVVVQLFLWPKGQVKDYFSAVALLTEHMDELIPMENILEFDMRISDGMNLSNSEDSLQQDRGSGGTIVRALGSRPALITEHRPWGNLVKLAPGSCSVLAVWNRYRIEDKKSKANIIGTGSMIAIVADCKISGIEVRHGAMEEQNLPVEMIEIEAKWTFPWIYVEDVLTGVKPEELLAVDQDKK